MAPPAVGVPGRARRSAAAQYDYGVMMDAGSTETVCYLYRWPRQYAHEEVPNVEPLMEGLEALSLKVTPGISSFAANLSGLEGYLRYVPVTITLHLRPKASELSSRAAADLHQPSF